MAAEESTASEADQGSKEGQTGNVESKTLVDTLKNPVSRLSFQQVRLSAS